MEPVNKDVKEAVLEAEKFFSVTLAQEKLSPAVEKQRSLLAEKFKNLKTQFGFQNDLPGGGKAPPRPPKGGMAVSAPVTSEDQEGGPEELYDDVAGVIADDSQGDAGSAGELNYEIMADGETTSAATPQGNGAGEDYMAMEDNDTPQENYEEPQQNEQNIQTSAVQEEEYEMPGADTEDYEVASQPSANNAQTETDEAYEGVETPTGSVDSAPMAGKEKSGTVLESLTKNTKPDDIEGVIKKGFLNKHRKEGKVYIGSRWQKRYCVVRNHVLYYFKDKKSPKQQGYILLPGYKVALANKRGREFTLTHPEGHRSFQFESNSKEETEAWMKAIQSAADAPLSESHNLDELRNKQPSDDESSLHYEKSGMEEPEEDDNANFYDDTNEDLYEEVGSIQPSTPSQQPCPPTPIQYEIGAVVSSPKPAEPVVDEDYECAEQSPAPAPPPPRPTKSQAPPPTADTPPAVPPPRPTKPQPPTTPMPIQEETYEEADVPSGATDLPPPPPPVEDIELENYEDLDTFQPTVPPPAPAPATAPAPAPASVPTPALAPAPVPARPPKRKTSPPSKPQEKVPDRPERPTAAKPAPPVPKRVDDPPPSPAEEKLNDINYANVYQALWNCKSSDNDELEFKRGDLIYIYEKPHADWWIGSLFKPQGYTVGLVPKEYVMEAYEFCAA